MANLPPPPPLLFGNVSDQDLVDAAFPAGSTQLQQKDNEIAFLKNQLALLTAQAQRTVAPSSDRSSEHSPSSAGRQHGRRPVYDRLERVVAGGGLDKGKGKSHTSPIRHHSTSRRRRCSNRRAKSQAESSFSDGSSLTPCHKKGVPGKVVSEGEPSV